MENREQHEVWNGPAGEVWVAMQASLDRQLEPIGRAVMAALAPRAGERLLDIGCGAGQTTRQLASAVGPTGSALGVDISAPLVAHARSLAGEGGPQFVVADAQTHAFPPGGADAMFSRFGVMFFADPVAAFANLHAALRPGGRLAFACWRPVPENPIFTIPMAAAIAAGLPEPAPGDPLAPGPFAFANPLRVVDILSRAGFRSTVTTPHDERIGGNGRAEAIELALRVGPLGRMLREHPDLRADTVIEAIGAAIAPYETPDGVLFPSATWIVTASA